METFWETNIWNKWKSESVNRLLNLMNLNLLKTYCIFSDLGVPPLGWVWVGGWVEVWVGGLVEVWVGGE